MAKLRKRKRFNINILFIVLIMVVISFISIGFASFSQNLNISSYAFVKPIKDIMITNVTSTGGSYNGENGGIDGYSTYNESNTKTIDVGAVLPDKDSYITYHVEITNIGANEMTLTNITGLPDGLKMEFVNDTYTYDQKICDDHDNCNLGIQKTIDIRVSYENDSAYDSSNTFYPLTLTFEFKKVYNVTYVNFPSTEDLPTNAIEGKTFELNYTLANNSFYKIYINGKILFTTEYTYEAGLLSIPNITDDLTIEISNQEDILLPFIPEGTPITISGYGLTITSHGEGVYTIDGTTVDSVYARLSDYMYIVNRRDDLITPSTPNDKLILAKGKHYDIVFTEISGSKEISGYNNARFVFREVNSLVGYQQFGYDFYSGVYGSPVVPLPSDLGMFSLYVAPGNTFNNYKFKIRIYEVEKDELEDIGEITKSVEACGININFYEPSGIIEYDGTTNGWMCYIDFDNKLAWTSLPDTSSTTTPKFNAGDKVKMTYKYISGYPGLPIKQNDEQIAFVLRKISSAAGALSTPRISTVADDLASDSTNEDYVSEDVSIASGYISGQWTFENYRFKLITEKTN